MKKLLISLFLFSILFFGFTSAITINFGLDELESGAGQQFFNSHSSYLSIGYDLGTPRDISTLSFTTSNSGTFTYGKYSYFNPTGTKFYVANIVGKTINEYDLSLAWDITSASFSDSLLIGGTVSSVYGFEFSTDGTKFYVGNTSNLYQFNCSSSRDIDTCSYSSNSYSLIAPSHYVNWKPDGTELYFANTNGRMYTSVCSSAWDLSTCYEHISRTEQDIYFSQSPGSLLDGSRSFDGTDLYVTNGSQIDQYSCSAYDFSSCSLSTSKTGFSSPIYSIFYRNDSLDSIDTFQTDFELKSNVLDLKFCGDFDVGDSLTLSTGSDVLNGNLDSGCFEFDYVPGNNYILELDGDELNKQYDGSTYSINNGIIDGFNNKLCDGSTCDTIASITSIEYTITSDDYIIVNVNGTSQAVALGLFDEITISNGNYIVSNGGLDYTFQYDNTLYYYDAVNLTVLQEVDLGNYDIFLSGVYDSADTAGGSKTFYAQETSDFDFEGYTPVFLESTGTMKTEVTSGNVFVGFQDTIFKGLFSNLPSYIKWVFGFLMLMFLLKIVSLFKRRK